MQSQRVIFHVDMNAFFASVEQQCNPHLRGKPIVVCGNAKLRTVVAACSYEAKAFGIKNGMSIPEAKLLCPQVIPVGGSSARYVFVSHRIFEILREYTPHVEVFSIDEAFMDMTHTWSLKGHSIEAVGRSIKKQIVKELGLRSSVGMAPNKLLAKLGSNRQKPDGLVRIQMGDIPTLMARLPIEDLCGIGKQLKLALNDLGIFTGADLGAASESMMVKRFGVYGRKMRLMGQGVDYSPVVATASDDSVKSMGHSYTLSSDTSNEETLRGVLLRLSEKVARRLRKKSYCGRTVSLTVRYAGFETRSWQQVQPENVNSGLSIYHAAWRLFMRHSWPLKYRVRLLGVSVSQLNREAQQLNFLDDEVKRRKIDACLDTMSDRFGEFSIVRARALGPLISKTHGFLKPEIERR